MSGVSGDQLVGQCHEDAVPAQPGREVHGLAGQEQHLPHEAAHVVQQREGRVQANTEVNGKPVNDSKSLESEADSMGARAASMKA